MARVTRGNIPIPDNPTKDFTPVLTDTAYKHSIVSSSRQPIAALLTHIEGMSLTVDYYSQVLGRDEEVSTFDPTRDGVSQQYLQIRKYELKLQSELTTSVDPVDQTMNITGTAMMYPYTKPNVGDVFIADVGDGQAGLFSITEVQKKSMFKQSVYEIDFILSDYLTQELEDNLTKKTVKVTEFVKDFMTYGQNPVIATMDKLKYDKLKDLLSDCLSDWLTEYYSVEFKTILVPNGNVPTYDPFITQMVTTIFDKSYHPILNNISLLNIEYNNAQYYTTIWDVIINKEEYMLRTCFTDYCLVDTKKLSRNPFMQTAYFSGIKKIVLPKTMNIYTDEVLGVAVKTNGGVLNTVDPENGFPPLNTNSYIFSSDFFTNHSGDHTDLEEMVSNYLEGKAIDWNKLVTYLKDRHSLTRLQRFYLVPVLLLLTLAEIRGI